MEDVTKLAEQLNKRLDAIEAKAEDKTEIETLKNKLEGAVSKVDLETINKDIEALALKVNGFSFAGGRDTAKKTLKQAINEAIKANEGKEKKDRNLEIVVKADTIFNLFSVAGNPNPSDEPNVDGNILFATAFDAGFQARLQREATILAKISGAVPIRIGDALKATIPYAETGKPLTVSEAKTKPNGTVKYKVQKKESTKIAIVFGITEEFMNRADYLMAEIQNHFVSLVSEVLEEEVFGNTTGILSYATPYVNVTGMSTTDATFLDAISAVATTMKLGRYKPDTVVLNSVAIFNMFGDKALDGHYRLANGGSIQLINGGSQLVVGNHTLDLVEVNNDLLDATEFVVCDWSKLKFGLGSFITKSDPYTHMRDNIVDFLIEAPFAVMLPENYPLAVVKSDFATVISEIETTNGGE
jgi:hypothetical protein